MNVYINERGYVLAVFKGVGIGGKYKIYIRHRPDENFILHQPTNAVKYETAEAAEEGMRKYVKCRSLDKTWELCRNWRDGM